MTAQAPSVLMDALVDMVGAAVGHTNVSYGPPQGVPTYPQIWIEYGPVEFEVGVFAVSHPDVRAVIAVPSGSDYATEYREANDLAHTVAVALLPSLDSNASAIIANELVITAIGIDEPVRVSFAGQDGAIMRSIVRLGVESKEFNT